MKSRTNKHRFAGGALSLLLIVFVAAIAVALSTRIAQPQQLGIEILAAVATGLLVGWLTRLLPGRAFQIDTRTIKNQRSTAWAAVMSSASLFFAAQSINNTFAVALETFTTILAGMMLARAYLQRTPEPDVRDVWVEFEGSP